MVALNDRNRGRASPTLPKFVMLEEKRRMFRYDKDRAALNDRRIGK